MLRWMPSLYNFAVAFGDSNFRHGLRNHLNSLNLGIAICDDCPLAEYPDWMGMIVQTADECIELLNDNLPEPFDVEHTPAAS